MSGPFEIDRLGPEGLDKMRGLNAMFGGAFDGADSYASGPPDNTWLGDPLGKP